MCFGGQQGISSSGDPSVAGGPDNPPSGGGILGGLTKGFSAAGGLPGIMGGMQRQPQPDSGGPQRQQPPLFGPDAFFKFLATLSPAFGGPNLLANLWQQGGQPQPTPGIGGSPRPALPGQ